MSYTPEHLERWQRPKSFAAWVDDWFYSEKCFPFLGQNRDSDALTRSNFTVALKALGGESDTVKVICESHWAVGHIEWIAIHESDHAALEKADGMTAALSEYPILCEDHFSELEYSEACDMWENVISLSERVDLCRKAGVSIFAARRDYMPSDDSGYILDMLRGY